MCDILLFMIAEGGDGFGECLTCMCDILLFMIAEGGDGFGEVALLEEDAVRNATVVADEDADLLVISREFFERSMKVRPPPHPSYPDTLVVGHRSRGAHACTLSGYGHVNSPLHTHTFI